MDRYPGLTLLLDHASSPALDDGPPYSGLQPLIELAGYPGLNVKVTTLNLRNAAKGSSTPRAFMEALRSSFGAGRLLWASNFPSSDGPLHEHLALARDAVKEFSEADRDAFLGGNAQRIYGIYR